MGTGLGTEQGQGTGGMGTEDRWDGDKAWPEWGQEDRGQGW